MTLPPPEAINCFQLWMGAGEPSNGMQGKLKTSVSVFYSEHIAISVKIRELSQCLRKLTALTKDPSAWHADRQTQVLIPSTHTANHNCNASLKTSSTLTWPPQI